MANKIITNQQGSLNWRDLIKGAIMAVGTPVLYILSEMIPNFNLDPIVRAGLSALITYLIKNVLAPASVVTTYSTNEQAVKVADKIENLGN